MNRMNRMGHLSVGSLYRRRKIGTDMEPNSMNYAGMIVSPYLLRGLPLSLAAIGVASVITFAGRELNAQEPGMDFTFHRVTSVPTRLVGTLDGWRAFTVDKSLQFETRVDDISRPWGEPYELIDNGEENTPILLKRMRQGDLPSPIEHAVEKIKGKPWTSIAGKTLVDYVKVHGGFVFRMQSESEYKQTVQTVHWVDSKGNTRILSLFSDQVNSLLVVNENLWIGGGSPYHDITVVSRGGWIEVLALEDGMWKRVCLYETEQSVWRMDKSNVESVFVLCPTLLLEYKSGVQKRVVYGYIGWSAESNGTFSEESIGPPCARWSMFDARVSLSVLGNSFYIGTPHGLIALTPYGKAKADGFAEIWIVPRRMYDHLDRTGCIRSATIRAAH